MSDFIDDFVNQINEDFSYIDENGHKQQRITAARIDKLYFTPDISDIRIGYECEIDNLKAEIKKPQSVIQKAIQKCEERIKHFINYF